MTDAAPELSRATGIRAFVTHPIVLAVAFVGTNVLLAFIGLTAWGLPLGDVTLVYKFWMEQAFQNGFWVGIDSVWVYPILAILPMIGATALGFDLYAVTWLWIVGILNAVAFGVLIGWGRRRDRSVAAWWWIAFLLCLGPIAVGRIDSITVPVAIVAMLVVVARPLLGGALLAVAAWIKVWPAALVLACVIALRERARVVLGAVLVTLVVLLGAIALGGGGSVLSFVTEQTGRGLQVEAPVSTIWMWMARAEVPGSLVYYDDDILTFQVLGPGSSAAAAIMTPLMAVAVAIVALLMIRAVRAGAHPSDLLAPGSLALVTALIAFNKVGSPQFVAWFAVPIIVGLVAHASGIGRSFAVPATLAVIIAALTQLIYPYFYGWLLALDVPMLSVITARNVLYFVVLGWAIHAIVTSTREARTSTEVALQRPSTLAGVVLADKE
ncbi:hypothetical protein M2152_000688 [Microbacteriaceae bacterium SG_E_30_P1]|uniref:DUF2029 domain-containing protein n=1 Tax=Antiquaquibacter oligotrophicus TaxID=2880260 RepID=A0ABT6KL73_9MICO|nr:glycosyltransferase 87 family protein [Antiquaquibacter oligotrophicus]MDH6180506.1 hypothetical protein [Antiquaquibacter oligotrophicus]UDF13759.1 DUF2029 domain-containing protein [Antiquaquibacter oligotrophicus]